MEINWFDVNCLRTYKYPVSNLTAERKVQLTPQVSRGMGLLGKKLQFLFGLASGLLCKRPKPVKTITIFRTFAPLCFCFYERGTNVASNLLKLQNADFMAVLGVGHQRPSPQVLWACTRGAEQFWVYELLV